MPKGTIEIKDRDDFGLPAIELGDILSLFKSEGLQLNWAILNLYAVGDLYRLGRTMRDLGDEIGAKPGGAVLNWHELEEFSRSVFQIMETKIVGYRGGKLPTRDEPVTGDCEFVIEAIDPSRWRLSVASDDVLARFKHVFHDWEMTGSESESE